MLPILTVFVLTEKGQKMKLIDGDKLIDKLLGANYGVSVIDIIAEMFTEKDAVKVVRCKDCKWRGSENCAMFYRCECGEQHTWETDNDFCSYGER